MLRSARPNSILLIWPAFVPATRMFLEPHGPRVRVRARITDHISGIRFCDLLSYVSQPFISNTSLHNNSRHLCSDSLTETCYLTLLLRRITDLKIAISRYYRVWSSNMHKIFHSLAILAVVVFVLASVRPAQRSLQITLFDAGFAVRLLSPLPCPSHLQKLSKAKITSFTSIPNARACNLSEKRL